MKARSVKIKTIVTALCGGNTRANLLPDADKVAIMEYMLQRPQEEVENLTNVGKPMFVTACARLLLAGKLDVYFSILKSLKNGDGV